MPYFAISTGTEDVGICQEESIDTVNPELVIGPGDWVVREITEEEANKFAEEWFASEIDPDDICPICMGHRSRKLVGEIVLRSCKDCEFES